MKVYVGDLAAVVGSRGFQETEALGVRNSGGPNAALPKSTPSKARKTQSGKKQELPAPKRSKPSQVIPFEEEDFKDF